MGLGLSKDDESVGQIFTVHRRLYRILETIGHGSEAIVYRCEDQSAAQYAVKVFYFSRYTPDELPRRIRDFKREARMLKYLARRPHRFLPIYDYEYNRAENTGYMILELGNGNLRDQISAIDDQYQRIYWKQIVSILKGLQDASVVHADIKPDNMIVVNNMLKLSDLGLAFPTSSPQATLKRAAIRGTLDYMAPEVYHHQTSMKSDVWSAGIILYEMAYGRPPYSVYRGIDEKAHAIASMTPIPFPPLQDPYLRDCIKKCLQFDPHLRPTAYELLSHPYTRS